MMIIKTIATLNVLDFVAISDLVSDKSKRKYRWLSLILSDRLLTLSGKQITYVCYDMMVVSKRAKIQPSYHFHFYDEDMVMYDIDHMKSYVDLIREA